MGFSPGLVRSPALKRALKRELSCGALKRSSRINAGAPIFKVFRNRLSRRILNLPRKREPTWRV